MQDKVAQELAVSGKDLWKSLTKRSHKRQNNYVMLWSAHQMQVCSWEYNAAAMPAFPIEQNSVEKMSLWEMSPSGKTGCKGVSQICESYEFDHHPYQFLKL